MIPLPQSKPQYCIADDSVRCQVKRARERLRQYRLARDRAQLERLEGSPRLKAAIAELLRAPLSA
jgi:hypothetical protein